MLLYALQRNDVKEAFLRRVIARCKSHLPAVVVIGLQRYGAIKGGLGKTKQERGFKHVKGKGRGGGGGGGEAHSDAAAQTRGAKGQPRSYMKARSVPGTLTGLSSACDAASNTLPSGP
jgi:hypothetical protein